LASHHAANPQASHESFYGATSNINPFTAELPPDLTSTVDAEVFFPHALNLSGKKRILPISISPPLRIGLKCLVVVIRRWGDW